MFCFKNADFMDYMFYGMSVFKNKCYEDNYFLIILNNSGNKKA